MITNEEFLDVVKKSFNSYLDVNTSRSVAKLKSLHGVIAKDLSEVFGDEYTVISQGFEEDREYTIDGRYYPKKVDITVCKDNQPVAGYAIKFVMRNYSQNSNNYFENMLGETANIRTNSIPYFQIFILFDIIPYYTNSGELKKFENITSHNLYKYIVLSKDDPSAYYHTPDKTLIVVLSLNKMPECVENSREYADFYLKIINDEGLISYSNKIADEFDNSVILNNYSDFIERTSYIVKGKQKN